MTEQRDSADMDVPGAPTSETNPTPLTVLTFLEEAKKERERQKPLMDEAMVRERIVLGEQWRGNDPLIEQLFTTWFVRDVPITENLLYPLCLTWAARVNQSRVDARAYPFQATPSDVLAAQASNAVLDYQKQQNNEDVLIANAAMFTQYHGDVLFYPQWVESLGPFKVRRAVQDKLGTVYDMETRQPQMEEAWEWGGVEEEVIPAPSYWTSGEDDYTKAQYLVVERVIGDNVAKTRLQAAGFFESAPKAQDYADKSATSIPVHGVLAYEIWLRPGARSKDGMYALVVDDRVVQCVPYPLQHRQLPGAVWKVGHIRGSPRGKTHVSDAIHQQRLVNVTLRSILQRATVAGSSYLVGPSGLLEQMKSSTSSRVNADVPGSVKEVSWFEGPEIPQTIIQLYDRARRSTYDVFGISEATATGGDPTQTKSGQQLRDATALDAQKIAPARRNLEEARLRVAKQKLQLWQQYVDNARLVRVVGPTGDVAAAFFRGADLMGADVALEVASGIQSTHLAGQRYAEESGQGGYISQNAAIERRETGLPTTVADDAMLLQVDMQAKAALQGQQQQPLPGIDPTIASERLSAHLHSPQAKSGDVHNLLGLIALYKQQGMQPAERPSNGPGRIQTGEGEPFKPRGAISQHGVTPPTKGSVQTTKLRQNQLEDVRQ